MSFVRPECATPGSLKIAHPIKLPPDSVRTKELSFLTDRKRSPIFDQGRPNARDG
jgi:hypothetical protein